MLKGAGLAEPVAEVAVDAQGLLQRLGRGRVITIDPPHVPQVVEGVGLAEPVAEVAVDAQGLLQGLGRGRVITRQPPHVPEVAEGVGLAEPVTEMPCGLDRGCVAGDGVGPGAVVPQEPGEAGGQGDDPGVLAGAGGVVQAGEQAGPLGAGPGQRLLPVGQAGNRGRDRAVRGGRGGAGLAGDEGVGAGGGVLVVIQQPGGGLSRSRSGSRRSARARACSRIRSCIRYRPRAGSVEQVLVVQGLQAAAGSGQVGAVQGGGGVGVDVGAGVQPQPAEQPLLVGR